MKLQAELGTTKNTKLKSNATAKKFRARRRSRIRISKRRKSSRMFFCFKHENQIYQIYVAPNGFVNIGNHQLEIL
jgi:hypothetical protein